MFSLEKELQEFLRHLTHHTANTYKSNIFFLFNRIHILHLLYYLLLSTPSRTGGEITAKTHSAV